MDIVLIFNGLGNQMSQYAFFLAKKQYNPHVSCIYYPNKYEDQHNGFELDKVFGIKISRDIKYYVSYFIYCLYLLKDQRNIKGKIIRKMLKYLRVKVIFENFVTYNFDPNHFSKKSGISYYWGGWHCEKYLDAIKDEILRLYQFNIDEKDTTTIELQKEIINKTSVSIHVRRGDYISKMINVFGDVCDMKYYNNAIKYIEQKVKDPYFYFFSDDDQWIKDQFNLKNSKIVGCNKGNNSWKDMYLMSQCKHNINANSTFSWWGAWLNENPEKIVIVPDKFIIQEEAQDIYPDLWVKIIVS